jgi:hypothetical protein
MPNSDRKLVKREIFSEVSAHLEKPEITLITGSRQVGKTVLLGQLKDYLIKNGINQESILFYNLDIISDWELFQNQTEFIEFVKEKSEKGHIYIFVDEAQKVPDAARFFKGVYDSNLNIKLILSGSSSLEIKAKFKETLSGRKIIFHLPVFTFLEFLRYKDKYLAELIEEKKNISAISQKHLFKFYQEYLIFGGYPRVVIAESKEEKKKIINEIYSSYVEKDAVGFFEIKNKTAFNRLLKLLAGQIGQLINVGELASNLSVDRETVERYIRALEETFILKKITPYFRNPRQEIIKSDKIYFLDLGIRNLLLENFNSLDLRADKGALLENAVLNEVLFRTRNKFCQIHFWRTKQKTEVDFVIEGGKSLLPIEVKFSAKINRGIMGLKNFQKKFKPKKSVVVSFLFSGQNSPAKTKEINFIYPSDLYKILV